MIPVHADRRAAAVLLGTIVLAGAGPTGPAHAQAPPAPDERAAAREFAFAAYRLRVALKAQTVDLARRFEAARAAFDSPECRPARAAMSRLPDDRDVETIVVAALIARAPIEVAMRPAFERFQAELERVPTADPALRSGRAEWRANLAYIARLPAEIDLCDTLERWRRAGFARAATPLGLDRELSRGAGSPDKLERAARRMRQLGVAPGAARRFTGATLLNGIA